ncbi:MAG: hypothetical protein WCS17_09355 [Prevotella sp.]
MAEIMYNNLYGAYREALCTIELYCMHHTAESYAPYSKLSNLTVTLPESDRHFYSS